MHAPQNPGHLDVFICIVRCHDRNSFSAGCMLLQSPIQAFFPYHLLSPPAILLIPCHPAEENVHFCCGAYSPASQIHSIRLILAWGQRFCIALSKMSHNPPWLVSHKPTSMPDISFTHACSKGQPNGNLILNSTVAAVAIGISWDGTLYF